jgi:hypothetical protein
MNPTIRRLLPILPLVVLGACATQPPVVPTAPETPKQAEERRTQASRPTYNLGGYPPAVREGYIDGCESAKGTQYARKDTKRFADDAQYQMGWNDGHSICGKR